LKIGINSGFGYSITQDQYDIDNNGFPDFAIGAPESDKVVLLRTKEVVLFKSISKVISVSPIDPTHINEQGNGK
jgi:hypothetical protein